MSPSPPPPAPGAADRIARAVSAMKSFVAGDETVLAFLARHEELRDLLQPMLLGEPSSPASKAPPAALLAGRYRLDYVLGAGGMGTVWASTDTVLRRQVAIKVLRAYLQVEERARQRFQREGQMMARLQHPSIVPVFEVGEFDDRPFFVMALIDGVPMSGLLAKVGGSARGTTVAQVMAAFLDLRRDAKKTRADLTHAPAQDAAAAAGEAAVPPATTAPWATNYVQLAVGWCIQVADALDFAHRAGLVHRDVKPSNILIRRDGSAMLSDFGLARPQDAHGLTVTGQFAGTPAYASPEHFAPGAGLDARSDVFSLGATLYEALTRERPFQGTDDLDTRERVVRHDPRPASAANPSVSRDLAAVVAKAMEKTKDRRYASAAAFADDLRRWQGGFLVLARPVTLHRRLQRWVTRNRLASAFLATLAASTVAVSWLAWQALASATVAHAATGAVTRMLAERDLAATAAEVERLWRDAARTFPVPAERADHLESVLIRASQCCDRLPEFERALSQRQAAGASREIGRLPETHPVRVEHRLTLEHGREVQAQLNRTWIDEHESALLHEEQQRTRERIDQLDRALKELRRTRMPNAELQAEHDQLEDLVWDLRDVRDRLIPRLDRFHRATTALAQAPLDAGAEWRGTISAIAADERYRGLQLRPQAGLLPLGQDPTTGYYEFAVRDTGRRPASRDADGHIEIGDDGGMVLVLLPAQTVTAGMSGQPVDLQPFFCSKFEVSTGQLEFLAELLPPRVERTPIWWIESITTRNRPATDVDWHTAQAILSHIGLALPTGLQWQYACAAEPGCLYWTGPDLEVLRTVANLANAPKAGAVLRTWRVDQAVAANQFGLLHMHGNVGEWLADLNGQVLADGTGRRDTLRRYRGVAGGSMVNDPAEPHVFSDCWRFESIHPVHLGNSTGLRPVRALDR